MKEVRCRFKNVDAKQLMEFRESSCLLTISAGQESHEDKRFKATVELIKNTFKYCVITLHDVLQRHTMALSQPTGMAEDFYSSSLMLGEKWLERNQRYIDEFGSNVTVIRWNEWLNAPNFIEKKKLILEEVNNNKGYKALFTNSINEYINRYRKRLDNPKLFNRERAEKNCFDYLVEECAVLCLWPDTGCQFEIYAGKHNDAMIETRNLFVQPRYPSLIRSLSIVFNRRPNMSPQKFSVDEELLVGRS